MKEKSEIIDGFKQFFKIERNKVKLNNKCDCLKLKKS